VVRNELAVAGVVTHASGTAERRASERMLKAKSQEAGRRDVVGRVVSLVLADRDGALRDIGVTPHVAQNNAVTKTGKQRRSAIDGRTTRHEGYGLSQSHRAAIECIFGYGKQHGTLRKTKHRGIASVTAKSAQLPISSLRPQLVQVAPPVASAVESGWRRNRRPHTATASVESCRRRGHGSVSLTDPDVWSGRASQEVFVDLSALRSCINVSGL
jgi:hypothetical protein